MGENLSIDEQLAEELWYLEICEERLAHVEKVEIDILEKKKTKSFLNDDEMLVHQYNPLEIDDAKLRLELCNQRIENLKKFSKALS